MVDNYFSVIKKSRQKKRVKRVGRKHSPYLILISCKICVVGQLDVLALISLSSADIALLIVVFFGLTI